MEEEHAAAKVDLAAQQQAELAQLDETEAEEAAALESRIASARAETEAGVEEYLRQSEADEEELLADIARLTALAQELRGRWLSSPEEAEAEAEPASDVP